MSVGRNEPCLSGAELQELSRPPARSRAGCTISRRDASAPLHCCTISQRVANAPLADALTLRPYFGGTAPSAGHEVSLTRCRFISKKRTGSLPGITRSPTSFHLPSFIVAV